jgi:hypothetical protein
MLAGEIVGLIGMAFLGGLEEEDHKVPSEPKKKESVKKILKSQGMAVDFD